MSKQKSSTNLDISARRWKQAIRDARVKISTLETSIEIFKGNLRNRVRWPGQSATRN